MEAQDLFKSTKPTRVDRLIRLDGLRGVLAVYVMLGHTVPFLPLPRGAMHVAEALSGHGLAAVQIFFALSGLVIVQSLSRFEGQVVPFLMARASRLLPVYLVVLIASTMLILRGGSPFVAMPWLSGNAAAAQIWSAGPPPHRVAEFLAHLVFLHGALPHALLPDAPFALLGPAWSLSTEWQFYAAISLLGLYIRPDGEGLHRLVIIFLAIAILARIGQATLPPPLRFSRAFMPNAAPYFALGIAAARLWQPRPAWRLFAFTIMVAMILGATHATGWARLGKMITPLAWAIAIAIQRMPARRVLRPLASLLAHPVTLWLGLISYPLYLVNEPVGRGLALLLAPFLAAKPLLFGLVWGFSTLAAAIAVAASLHYGIERRFLRSRSTIMPPDSVPTARAS